MEVNGEQTISQSPDPLWDILLDATTLEQTIPGAQNLDRDGDHYEGTLERGLAGISISLSANVDITDQAHPEWIVCDIEGTDNTINSRVDGEAHVDFEETDEGKTELAYQVEFDFSGKLASLGSRIIKRKVNNDVETFFTNLQEYIENQADKQAQ
jgi:carbon monoxide dehydrogenase subunit G